MTTTKKLKITRNELDALRWVNINVEVFNKDFKTDFKNYTSGIVLLSDEAKKYKIKLTWSGNFYLYPTKRISIREIYQNDYDDVQSKEFVNFIITDLRDGGNSTEEYIVKRLEQCVTWEPFVSRQIRKEVKNHV